MGRLAGACLKLKRERTQNPNINTANPVERVHVSRPALCHATLHTYCRTGESSTP